MRLKGGLIKQYIRIHKNGKRYSRGGCIQRYVLDIAEICHDIPTFSILDYGCGGGKQYTEQRIYIPWGVMPTLFDPGVVGTQELPEGTFDGVICTGVLEHIPEEEIDQALNNLARYADKWAFLVIGIEPTRKLLPDGRQSHVTLKSPEWWSDKIIPAFVSGPGQARAQLFIRFEP